MELNTYRQTLETAKSEMGELLLQRKAIDERIGKLAPVIEYLSVLCDELSSPPPDLEIPGELPTESLSYEIRLAFKAAIPGSLTPTEVRDRLKEANFNLDKYENELPPIHNTIKRLKEQGEIEEVSRPNGERAYKWISSLKRALLEIEPNIYGSPRGLGEAFGTAVIPPIPGDPHRRTPTVIVRKKK